MLCEVCGKEVPFTKRVLIEGSVLRACQDCTRFGKEVETRRPDTASDTSTKVYIPTKKPAVKDIYKEMGDTDLTSDYGARIRNARSSRGLKQEDLGKMINERKSVIEQLENGRIRPDDKLVTKIERALNIRLKEKVSEEPVTLKKGGFTLTLGDLIKNGKK